MKTIYKILITSFLGLLYLVLPLTFIGQTNNTKAELLMQKFEYAAATELYLEYFKKNTATDRDLRNISYCYIAQNDTKSAINWLQKLIGSNNVKSEDIKIFAELLKSEGRYSEAKRHYLKYAEMNPEDSEFADLQIKACENSIEWTNRPEHFIVTNIEHLNSEKSDFALTPFGDKFLLTSDRINKNKLNKSDTYGWTGNPYLSLYLVDFNLSDFSVKSIKLMDEFNDAFHNGPAIYDKNNKTVYFTRTKTVKQNQKPSNPDPTSWFVQETPEIYTNKLEIYSSKQENGIWSDIIEFENNNTTEFSVGHPALSKDGKTIYFTADIPGGYGGTDIWYSEKTAQDTWGPPQNAGKNINTAGKEMFPYIDDNGDLYFSSDGHPGMGGLDLFKAKGEKNKWSNPENLKYPINSPKDDFSIFFTVAKESGFFASNRYGGQGSDDIYSFVYSPPTELILAVTTKEITKDGNLIALSGVKVDILSENEKFITSVSEDITGVFYTKLDCNQSYTIEGTKDEYFTQSSQVFTKCETKNDTIFVELVFEKIEIDKPIAIENIYYDFDKWNIRQDATVELDKIIALLLDNPHITIELGSHTDARGTNKYNEKLSQRRAKSAVKYITNNGVSSDRITAKGYGEEKPINQCIDGVYCSEDNHQLNRRTEFKVTGFSKQQPVIYSASE